MFKTSFKVNLSTNGSRRSFQTFQSTNIRISLSNTRTLMSFIGTFYFFCFKIVIKRPSWKYNLSEILGKYNSVLPIKWFHCFLVGLEMKCWFLGRKKNRMTRIGNLGERTRTNDKLNPNVTPSLRIEPRPQWWEVNTPITMECKLLTWYLWHVYDIRLL